jgi:hypothetical protein
MAWGAELAALLKLGICVLARSDIVQGAGKELMVFERPPVFVGKYSGSVGERKSRDGIEVDIPDFVAEVASDAFGSDSLNRNRLGIKGHIEGRHGNMAGSAIAVMVWIIKFVPRSVIGLFRIRGKCKNLAIFCPPIAG